jgi:hypothetical protein
MLPAFSNPLPADPAPFFDALRAAVGRSQGRIRGSFFPDGAMLRLREEDRHLWSPALHLFVDEHGPERLLRGKFSPSSPVWTAFVAIYLALGCIAIACGCYGLAQWTIGQAPWWLLGVPVAIALAGFTYGAAFIGQGLGSDEMYELRSLVDHVRESFEAPRPGASESVEATEQATG